MGIILNSMSEKSKNDLISDLKKFYIPYRDGLDLPDDVTFGLEIEFKNPTYNKEYINKISKSGYHDSAKEFLYEINCPMMWKYRSESYEQIEIISNILNDSVNNWNTLEYLLNFLIEKECYASKYSGAHIHIGKQIFNESLDFFCYFLELWSIFEKEIVKFSNGEKYNERYTFVGDATYSSDLMKKIIYDIKDGQIDNPIGLLAFKSNSICFPLENRSISDFIKLENEAGTYGISDTIEIRCPNGTLNKVIWQNNVNFFIKLILACKKENFDKEYIDFLYENYVLKGKCNLPWKELILSDIVFDNDLDKKCFLRQYYKDFNEPKRHDIYAKSTRFWK